MCVRNLLLLLFVTSGLLSRSIAMGAVANSLSDFEDGTFQEWLEGARPAMPVLNVPGGPGTSTRAAQAKPVTGRDRFYFHTVSAADFLGDYVSAGITGIQFDVRAADASAEPLTLRAVVMNGSRWVSNDSVTITLDGAWQTHTLSLLEPDVVRALGADTYAADFANVGRVGLRHQVGTGSGGEMIPTSAANLYEFDNIMLLAAASLACDFNGDGLCDVSDLSSVDGLFSAGDLTAGIPVGQTAAGFDLNSDGTVNGDDLDAWLAQAATENGFGSPYLDGDSNLNGMVDFPDFISLSNGFTGALEWTAGNFDGSANGTQFKDFIVLSNNFGMA